MNRPRAGSHWSMVFGLTLAVFVLSLTPAELRSAGALSKEFRVVVIRQKTEGRLISGRVSVDGKDIGPCYENEAKAISAGTYRGVIRTRSMKNFVQGPGGRLGRTGDFLLEVADVPHRTDILFHPGNRPEHSDGCILGGPATTDPATGDHIAPPTLKSMRLAFFDGHDNPDRNPDKAITVEVREFAP